MDNKGNGEVNGIESARGIETAKSYGVSESAGDAMANELAALRAENETLKRKASETKVSENNLTFKVSEKGGVSVYGLGRFPITLYLSQWERLTKAMPQLVEFIGANLPLLKTKEQDKDKPVTAMPPTIRRAVNGGT